MFHDQDFSVEEIARCVRTRKHKIHERTVRNVLERFDEAGQVSPNSSCFVYVMLHGDD